MAVYVDQPIWRWAGHKWCHMLADDVEELHRFAASIGVHRLLYQGPPKTSAPHYDITGMERARALFRRVKVMKGKVHRPNRPVPSPIRARA